MTIYDMDATGLINKLAPELKKIIKAPEWAGFVKTGISRERPPVNADWWYVRAASILRWVMLKGPIGVEKLRIKYGSRKNRGVAGEHAYKSAGNHIRKILQQLEKAELIKQAAVGVHKGRIVTPKGIALINSISKNG